MSKTASASASTSAAAAAASEPLLFPARIVIDTREQRPFAFASIRADARQGRRPVQVETIRRALAAGDYSIDGHESTIAVERKSVADLFGTLGKGRERFVRELDRLATYAVAAVVVEGEWSDVLLAPPDRSQLNPKTIYRSVIAWQQRYPRIHWWMVPGRAVAETTTFRILERFVKDRYR